MDRSVLLFIVFLLGTIVSVNGQLTSSDPSIYDGPCDFPQQLALNANVPKIYNPMSSYYVPLANKVFRRAQYEILNNQSATAQAQLESLEPRLHVFGYQAISLLADLSITFAGGSEEWYAYRCIPSNLAPLSLINPLAPLLNLTCSVPGGSSAVKSEARVGVIYYSIIWSDSTAFTCWGCINGRQIFHIMSLNSTLTPAQISANVALLTPLGFDVSNYENMPYE